MTDVLSRARAYVAKMPIAVAGQRGHSATFKVAATLVHGFGLSEDEAFPLLEEYSAQCQPPWSRKELEHKLESATKTTSSKPRGHLRNARRDPDAEPPPRPKKKIKLFSGEEKPKDKPKAESPVCNEENIDEANRALDEAREKQRTEFEEAEPERGQQEEVALEAPPPPSEDLSKEDLAEAHRIAAELVKLYRAGAIRGPDDPEAAFYARLLRGFGGRS